MSGALCICLLCRVEAALLPRGWVRISDADDTNFRLRWTEVKSQINYREFKAGKGTKKIKWST